MKDFLQLAKDRYSVRSFTSQKVEDEKISKILEAGRIAPTACNNQPQRIYVINSEEGLEKLRKCTSSHFNCSLAMLVCYDRNQSWKRNYDGQDSGWVDASIVQTHMMLEAAELGIGSTWVMHFIPDAVKEEFALAGNIIPVGLLVMGYPSEKAAPIALHDKKKELKETVEFI